MEVEIIPLAKKKIKSRRIKLGMVYRTVRSPDQTVEGYGGRIVKQKIWQIHNKEKLLRAVCEERPAKTVVITAYLTSSIKRYWENED